MGDNRVGGGDFSLKVTALNKTQTASFSSGKASILWSRSLWFIITTLLFLSALAMQSSFSKIFFLIDLTIVLTSPGRNSIGVDAMISKHLPATVSFLIANIKFARRLSSAKSVRSGVMVYFKFPSGNLPSFLTNDVLLEITKRG